MLRNIIEQLGINSEHLLSRPSKKISSINIGKFGISFSSEDGEELTFRSKLQELISQINDKGAGVLFTIDEITGDAVGLDEFSTTFQHFLREDRNVALMLSGLPNQISNLLSKGGELQNLTFLRRAERIVLGAVDIEEIQKSYSKTISKFGRSISETDLVKMSNATRGYPFMIQLIGYYCWRNSIENEVISEFDVKEGIKNATNRLGSLVLESSLLELSQADMVFLSELAVFDGEILTSEVGKKFGISPQYIQVYRKRLIEAGLINVTRFGKVNFAIPYLREYIRENVADKYLK